MNLLDEVIVALAEGNDCHNPAGEGGGQFCSAGTSGQTSDRPIPRNRTVDTDRIAIDNIPQRNPQAGTKVNFNGYVKPPWIDRAAELAGGQPGAQVTVYEDWRDTPGTYLVEFTNTGVNGSLRVDDPGGIYFEELYVNHDVGGDGYTAPHGTGMKIMAGTIKAARDLGMSDFRLKAAGSLGSSMNGYYTWPRMGFEGKLTDDQVRDVYDTFGVKVKTVQDVFDLPGIPSEVNAEGTLEGRESGRIWWKENGEGFSAKFDMKDGSRSMKRMGRYLKERFGRNPFGPLNEVNDCHNPAGTSEGGQFCSSDGLTSALGDAGLPPLSKWWTSTWASSSDPNKPGQQSQFQMTLNPDGKSGYFDMLQLANAGKGQGTKIFAALVADLKKQGVETLKGRPTGAKNLDMNGYYSSAMWGFDAPIPNVPLTGMSPEWAQEHFKDPSIKTVQDILAKPGGPEWWKENGGGFHGVFDLRDGSRSMRQLQKYMKGKGLTEANDCHNPAGTPKGGQFCSTPGTGPEPDDMFSREGFGTHAPGVKDAGRAFRDDLRALAKQLNHEVITMRDANAIYSFWHRMTSGDEATRAQWTQVAQDWAVRHNTPRRIAGRRRAAKKQAGRYWINATGAALGESVETLVEEICREPAGVPEGGQFASCASGGVPSEGGTATLEKPYEVRTMMYGEDMNAFVASHMQDWKEHPSGVNGMRGFMHKDDFAGHPYIFIDERMWSGGHAAAEVFSMTERARIAKFIQETMTHVPEMNRLAGGALVAVNFKVGPNPDDPYWAKTYGVSSFTSAATGGNREVTFYGPGMAINEAREIFAHEVGHLVSLSGTNDWRGDPAREAEFARLQSEYQNYFDIASEAKWGEMSRGGPRGGQPGYGSLTPYGSMNWKEDFAELYRLAHIPLAPGHVEHDPAMRTRALTKELKPSNMLEQHLIDSGSRIWQVGGAWADQVVPYHLLSRIKIAEKLAGKPLVSSEFMERLQTWARDENPKLKDWWRESSPTPESHIVSLAGTPEFEKLSREVNKVNEAIVEAICRVPAGVPEGGQFTDCEGGAEGGGGTVAVDDGKGGTIIATTEPETKRTPMSKEEFRAFVAATHQKIMAYRADATEMMGKRGYTFSPGFDTDSAMEFNKPGSPTIFLGRDSLELKAGSKERADYFEAVNKHLDMLPKMQELSGDSIKWIKLSAYEDPQSIFLTGGFITYAKALVDTGGLAFFNLADPTLAPKDTEGTFIHEVGHLVNLFGTTAARGGLAASLKHPDIVHVPPDDPATIRSRLEARRMQAQYDYAFQQAKHNQFGESGKTFGHDSKGGFTAYGSTNASEDFAENFRLAHLPVAEWATDPEMGATHTVTRFKPQNELEHLIANHLIGQVAGQRGVPIHVSRRMEAMNTLTGRELVRKSYLDDLDKWLKAHPNEYVTEIVVPGTRFFDEAMEVISGRLCRVELGRFGACDGAEGEVNQKQMFGLPDETYVPMFADFERDQPDEEEGEKIGYHGTNVATLGSVKSIGLYGNIPPEYKQDDEGNDNADDLDNEDIVAFFADEPNFEIAANSVLSAIARHEGDWRGDIHNITADQVVKYGTLYRSIEAFNQADEEGGHYDSSGGHDRTSRAIGAEPGDLYVQSSKPRTALVGEALLAYIVAKVPDFLLKTGTEFSRETGKADPEAVARKYGKYAPLYHRYAGTKVTGAGRHGQYAKLVHEAAEQIAGDLCRSEIGQFASCAHGGATAEAPHVSMRDAWRASIHPSMKDSTVNSAKAHGYKLANRTTDDAILVFEKKGMPTIEIARDAAGLEGLARGQYLRSLDKHLGLVPEMHALSGNTISRIIFMAGPDPEEDVAGYTTYAKADGHTGSLGFFNLSDPIHAAPNTKETFIHEVGHLVSLFDKPGDEIASRNRHTLKYEYKQNFLDAHVDRFGMGAGFNSLGGEPMRGGFTSYGSTNWMEDFAENFALAHTSVRVDDDGETPNQKRFKPLNEMENRIANFTIGSRFGRNGLPHYIRRRMEIMNKLSGKDLVRKSFLDDLDAWLKSHPAGHVLGEALEVIAGQLCRADGGLYANCETGTASVDSETITRDTAASPRVETESTKLAPELYSKVARVAAGKGSEVKLTSREIKEVLHDGVYGIIGAGRSPLDKDWTPEKERERYNAIIEEAKAKGYRYMEAKGKYGQEEPSILVFIPEAQKKDIVEMGKRFNQDSVIWGNQGKQRMIFTTGEKVGKGHPGRGYKNIVSPEQLDFFTEIPARDGPYKFALKFNFNRLVERLRRMFGPEVLNEFIKRVSGGFRVVSHQTGKNFGTYKSKGAAKRRLRQMARFR